MTNKSCLQILREHNNVIADAARSMGIARQVFYSKLASEVARGNFKEEAISKIEEHNLRLQIKKLKAELKESLDSRIEDQRRIEAVSGFAGVSLDPPKWLTPPRRKGKDFAIATAVLSDTHFDEVVRAEEMEYDNAYNRKIAELRLKKFFRSTARLGKEFMSGIEVEGLVLCLGGDIVGGNIHEELAETNDAPIMDTCLFWAEQIAAGIEQTLNHYPNIVIPTCVGNHGRLHRKPRYKNRVRDNYDWLIYKIIEKHFRAEKRVQFLIPESMDTQYKVYNTRYRLTHGDQFHGGGGIGGITVPIMRGDAKKKKRQVTVGRPYDILVMGHWHQLIDMGSVIINGSLKGYDEYASGHNFDYEPAQQAFWLTDAHHGKTITAPIHVQSEEEKLCR